MHRINCTLIKINYVILNTDIIHVLYLCAHFTFTIAISAYVRFSLGAEYHFRAIQLDTFKIALRILSSQLIIAYVMQNYVAIYNMKCRSNLWIKWHLI